MINECQEGRCYSVLPLNSLILHSLISYVLVVSYEYGYMHQERLKQVSFVFKNSFNKQVIILLISARTVLILLLRYTWRALLERTRAAARRRTRATHNVTSAETVGNDYKLYALYVFYYTGGAVLPYFTCEQSTQTTGTWSDVHYSCERAPCFLLFCIYAILAFNQIHILI